MSSNGHLAQAFAADCCGVLRQDALALAILSFKQALRLKRAGQTILPRSAQSAWHKGLLALDGPQQVQTAGSADVLDDPIVQALAGHLLVHHLQLVEQLFVVLLQGLIEEAVGA